MRRFSVILAGLAVGAALVMASPPVSAMGSNNDDDGMMRSSQGEYEKAVAAVNRKDYRQAIRLLSNVLMDEPRNADALNYMGYSNRKLGDYKKAVSYYLRALRADPDHRGANEYLGEAYLELRNLPKAEERLAHLWNICGRNCKEYRQLQEAVAAYKAGRRPNQSSRATRW